MIRLLLACRSPRLFSLMRYLRCFSLLCLAFVLTAKSVAADNAVLSYNIEIVKDGRPQRVVIDAETGGKVANPDTSLEAWKPEDALMRSLKMKP